MTKMETKNQVSEIDNMALTAILSTQILHDLFINRSMPALTKKDLVQCHKTILDY